MTLMVKPPAAGEENLEVNGDVLIHVRYWPDGEVWSIDRQPARLTAQEWRNQLLDHASQYYRTFANGRGFFRIPQAYFNGFAAQFA
jgi:hypothetical protein